VAGAGDLLLRQSVDGVCLPLRCPDIAPVTGTDHRALRRPALVGRQHASLMALRTAVDRIARYTSAMITRLDFIGIPSQDADRARSFYRDTLGLRPDEHGDYEQWAGDTCFGIWEPKKMGMPFVAQKGNPWALGCGDVAATRAELEAKGVEFAGDTFDTGVCHMAFFSDPDGNDLMLHHRYAPYA
jgi:catechol 2,3-dioxygenase-like lactoylglutathione lyase family enzyme